LIQIFIWGFEFFKITKYTFKKLLLIYVNFCKFCSINICCINFIYSSTDNYYNPDDSQNFQIMIDISKKNFNDLIKLNTYLLLIYFIVFLNLNTGVNETVMFSTPDSKDYLDVGNWIFDNSDTEQTINNPVLYPFILKLMLKFSGVYGVWFLQFIFWLLSVNLLFSAIKRLTNKLFAYFGAVIFSLNFSFIALTLHALTDVTVTFVLCWLIYYLTVNYLEIRKWTVFCNVILFFSVLSIIKPVFFPLLIVLLIIVFPVFYLKEFLNSQRKYLLIVALVPVIFQLSLMYAKHNIITISAKGNTTFKTYFFAQSYAEVNNINIDAAVDSSKNLSQDYIYGFMLDNKKIITGNFISNILSQNITGPATFLAYPPGHENMFLFQLMKIENNLFLALHFLFLIPCIIFIFYLRKSSSYKLALYIYLILMFYYLVLITGIAFWQGDRYTISFQPLWILIYLSVVYIFYSVKFNSGGNLVK